MSSLLEILKEGLPADEDNEKDKSSQLLDVEGIFMLKPDWP